MHDDFHLKLQDFDMRRGKDPIDGRHIQGFGGPGDPPPPDERPEVHSATDLYGPPVEPLEDPLTGAVLGHVQPSVSPVSPLIVRGLAPPANPPQISVAAPRAPIIPEAELWITNDKAGYKGRLVTLTDPEKAQVAKLLIRALRRDLDSLEVGGAKVRRKRDGSGSRRSSGTTGPPEQTHPDTSGDAPSISPPLSGLGTRRRKRGSLLG